MCLGKLTRGHGRNFHTHTLFPPSNPVPNFVIGALILRLRSTVWHTRAHVGQSPYKTIGYMRMNFSHQFARTIIDRETVCKAVLILQQQR